MSAAGSAERRLRELGERWALDPGRVSVLRAVLELLASDPHAPTTVRGEAAVDVHVADSLAALALECVREARTVADLGSGAGFPGVVLAVALPGANVALVESAARKCEWLERVVRDCGVANATVVCARAEEWVAGRGCCDLVVARALAPLGVVCEYAAPLLALRGWLVAWKGDVGAGEAQAALRAAELLGLQSEGAVRSEPYAGSVAHRLQLFRKVAPTPDGYPRRAGMARRRPLGEAE